MDRRRLLQQGLGGALSATLLARTPLAQAATRLRRDPFTLGVASGYPTPDSLVLWTRLAPEPLAPDGGMPPEVFPVRWELAADENFRRIVRSGVAYAEPHWAHSVHVEPQGLEPGRSYWYRFTASGTRSAVGRTWTAPKAGAPLSRLRLAVASCQQFEHGYYNAYRRMLADELDLIVHVGDYIYEMSWGEARVRHHEGGECYSLGDYRARYAQYHTDADLQAAHAACPWLVTWDDHEVDNDYAGEVSEQDDDPALMRLRRAAAYQAYYEHLPLPRRALPFGADLRLYGQRTFGDLVNVLLLDERQYRASHACPRPGARGGNRVRQSNCPELSSESRSMLGVRQEAWLGAQLRQSKARWNLLAQGVVMMPLDEDPGEERVYWSDGWNGYPAARQRLLQQLQESRVTNPLILSGDIHAFVAGELSADPAIPASPLVASELVTTSISSQLVSQELMQRYSSTNGNVRFASAERRGYLRLDITPSTLRADMIGVDSVAERSAAASVMKSYALMDGVRGLLEN